MTGNLSVTFWPFYIEIGQWKVCLDRGDHIADSAIGMKMTAWDSRYTKLDLAEYKCVDWGAFLSRRQLYDSKAFMVDNATSVWNTQLTLPALSVLTAMEDDMVVLRGLTISALIILVFGCISNAAASFMTRKAALLTAIMTFVSGLLKLSAAWYASDNLAAAKNYMGLSWSFSYWEMWVSWGLCWVCTGMNLYVVATEFRPVELNGFDVFDGEADYGTNASAAVLELPQVLSYQNPPLLEEKRDSPRLHIGKTPYSTPRDTTHDVSNSLSRSSSTSHLV